MSFHYLVLINSGGWKARVLQLGKEDGYSQGALAPFVGAHKLASVMSSSEKANAAWDNAAHATVTGVGLLFIVKSKAVDIPLNIINLVLLHISVILIFKG